MRSPRSALMGRCEHRRRITRKSQENLGIAPGATVFAQIKSVALWRPAPVTAVAADVAEV